MPLMRVTFILLYALGFSAYAYRDWFASLCALVLFSAVLEHPAMPKGMFGIQGFNPWNVLLGNVILGWLLQRRRKGIVWDFSPAFTAMLALYAGVILVSFARMLGDRNGIEELAMPDLVSEYLINPMKWPMLGLLLFDGCRTRQRLVWGLGCTLAIYVIVALLVIHSMPFGAALGGVELNRQSREVMPHAVGFYPTTLSMMMAGAAWAILAAAPALRRNTHRACAIALAAIVIYAQALTAGRMGYATWIAIGAVLCTLRRYKIFLAAPILAAVTLTVVHGAPERMAQGFNEPTESGHTRTDLNKVTSGRLLAWSLVVEKIGEAPLTGYGRLAMKRTEIARRLLEGFGESFPHPHNAYLECLLDNGVIGLLLLVPFYVTVVIQAARLFRSRDDPWDAAVGGATLAVVLALLIASIGGQTFYPREDTIAMWACIGLCLAAYRNLAARSDPTRPPEASRVRAGERTIE